MFRATTLVLRRVGLSGLTLESVAVEVGCKPQSISRRFGSKRGLLEAYLGWIRQRIEARFDAARARSDGPLAALRARVVEPMDDRTEEFSSLQFWSESRRVPELMPLIEGFREIWNEQVGALLREAQECGELGDVDVDLLTKVLAATMHGVVDWFALDSDDEMLRWGVIAFDTLIDPYRRRRETR